MQRIWERMHQMALDHMNIGRGGQVEESGELWLLRELDRQLWKGKGEVTVFDVGGNHGHYAAAVRDTLGPRVRLHVFEPSRVAFDLLSRRCPPSDRVHLHNYGLGAENASMTLYADEPGGGLGSVYPRRLAHFGLEARPQETIEIRSFPEACKDLGVTHVDLLKLDVEGHELAILQAAKPMLDAGAIDVIQFEFGGCNVDSRTYFQDFWYLLDPHYRIHRLLPRGLTLLEKYRETHEAFLTTNFVAVRRALLDQSAR